jgi:hypothetical protein
MLHVNQIVQIKKNLKDCAEIRSSLVRHKVLLIIGDMQNSKKLRLRFVLVGILESCHKVYT